MRNNSKVLAREQGQMFMEVTESAAEGSCAQLRS
jgi:hypothetical protein